VQITSHLSKDATDQLGSAITDLSIGTTKSSSTLLAALAPVAGELQLVQGSAVDAASATSLLQAAMRLTTSSGGDLSRNVKSLTDLLLVYHLKTADAATVSDTLFQAHASLGIGVDRLAMMLQRLQPRIAGSGVSMSTLLAIVTKMTPAAGTGTRALMSVGSILQSLQQPSQTAADSLAKLHITLTNSQGQFLGFEAVLGKIHDAYIKMAKPADRAAFLTELFGRNANLAKSLVEGGIDSIRQAEAALQGHGTAAEAAAIKGAELGSQIDKLKTSIESMATAIGRILVPMLTTVIGYVRPIIDEIARWVAANPELATGLLAAAGAIGALVAGLAVTGPVLGALSTAMELVGGPVLAAIAGFLLLQEVLSSMPGVLKPLQPLFDSLSAAVAIVGPVMASLFGALSDFVKGRGSIEAVGRALGNLGAALGQALSGILGALGDIAGKIIAWAAAMIPIWAAALEKWAGAFIAWIGPMIPQFLAGLGSFIVGVLGWIGQQVPALTKTLIGWVEAFVNWIAPMAAQALTALGAWLGGILGWVAKQLPSVVSAILDWVVSTAKALAGDLAEWTKAFVDWIAPIAQQALVALGRWIGDLTSWIAQQVGVIADHVGKWAGAFIDWVATLLPKLIDGLNGMIDKVAAWIGDSGTIKNLSAGLVDWIAPFVAWAGDAAIKVVAGLVLGLGAEIVKEGPQIAGAVISGGVQIITGLAQGIIAHPEILAGAIALAFAGGAVVGAIRLAGAAAAVIYTTAMRLEETIQNAIGAAWQGLQTGVIKAAGFVAGAVYGAAMEMAEVVLDVVSDAWTEVVQKPAVHVAVATAASVAGAVYGGVENFVKPLAGGLATAWAAAGADPAVIGAASAAGAEAGAANAAAAGAETAVLYGPGGQIISTIERGAPAVAEGAGAAGLMAGKTFGARLVQNFMGSMQELPVVGGAFAQLAGSSIGRLLTLGFSAGIVLLDVVLLQKLADTYNEWKAKIQQQGAALATQTATFVKNATLAQLQAARAAVVQAQHDVAMADPTGIFSGDAEKGLQGQLDTIDLKINLDMSNVDLRAKVAQLQDEARNQSGRGFGISDAVKRDLALAQQALDQQQNAFGASLGRQRGFLKMAADETFKVIPDAAWQAHASAVEAAFKTPGDMAAALKQGRDKVKTEADALRAALKAAAELPTLRADLAKDQAALLAAEKAHNTALATQLKTDIAGINKQILDDVGLLGPSVAEQMSTLRSQYTQAQLDLKTALALGRPDLVLAAQQEISDIQAQWDLLGPAAQKAGLSVPEGLKQGLFTPITTNIPYITAIKTQIAGLPPFAHTAGFQTATQFQTAVSSITATAAKEKIPVIAAVRGAMTAIKADAYGYGQAAATNWNAGFTSIPPQADGFAGKISALLKLASPAKEGPLSEAGGPGAWGQALARNYRTGFEQIAPQAITAVRSLSNSIGVALRSGNSYAWGYHLMADFAEGIRAGIPLITSSVHLAASKIAALLKLASPAEEGPLSVGGPEAWGARFDELFARGLLGGEMGNAANTVAAALSARFSGLGPTAGGFFPGGGPAFGLATATAAGGQKEEHIHIYLDGQEIKGFVSRVMFEEERRHAGPAVAGSAF
jgi:TP901 family phage tail tape measure protein